MRIQIPVGKLIAFAAHATGKAKGGLTKVEARELGAELLAIAAPLAVGVAPPVVGTLLDPLLAVAVRWLTDPPATVEEAAAEVLGIVAPFVPASVGLDYTGDADPIITISD